MFLVSSNIGDIVTRPEWAPEETATVLEVSLTVVLIKNKKGEVNATSNDSAWRIVYSKGMGTTMKRIALSLLATLSLSGCVSIPFFEQKRRDAWWEGKYEGLRTTVEVLNESKTLEEAKGTLQFLIGCQQFPENKKDGPKW